MFLEIAPGGPLVYFSLSHARRPVLIHAVSLSQTHKMFANFLNTESREFPNKENHFIMKRFLSNRALVGGLSKETPWVLVRLGGGA
jgi:hypothetical protein